MFRGSLYQNKKCIPLLFYFSFFTTIFACHIHSFFEYPFHLVCLQRRRDLNLLDDLQLFYIIWIKNWADLEKLRLWILFGSGRWKSAFPWLGTWSLSEDRKKETNVLLSLCLHSIMSAMSPGQLVHYAKTKKYIALYCIIFIGWEWRNIFLLPWNHYCTDTWIFTFKTIKKL